MFSVFVVFLSFKMVHGTRQSRSQSMPVRGLGLGIALAKPNEICNFIGCREINETDIGSKQYKRRISARIMRGNAITM